MVIARTLTPNPLPQAGEGATRVVPRTDSARVLSPLPLGERSCVIPSPSGRALVCYPLSLWERVRVRGSEATCHR